MPLRLSRGWALLIPFAFGLPAAAQHPADVDDGVLAIAEVMPEFPGGMPALRTYLMRHFEFPEEAMDAHVTGPINISFIVMKDGSLHDVRLTQGQHPALDAEALRLVASMPNWIPGRQHGKPVNVLYTLPFRFGVPVEAPPPRPVAEAK